MAKTPLIVLTGPTAVGKTNLSIKLAKTLGGEIISADSMQVYKHMDIGSAKITQEEMAGVTHHMIDILGPFDEFNVVIFKEKVKQCIEEIVARNHIPILTGGTGFYRHLQPVGICTAGTSKHCAGSVVVLFSGRYFLWNLSGEEGSEA